MACFNFILFLFITLSLQLINQAIPVEGVNGGQPTKLTITYQLAVLYKESPTDGAKLAGSGALISKNLALTTALCFFNDDGTLRKAEFLVLASTINWAIGGSPSLIDKMFLPEGDDYKINNIAVTTLETEFDVDKNPFFSKVKIPRADEKFEEQLGQVAGYGVNYVELLATSTSSNIRLSAGSDGHLRHAQVLVSLKTNCLQGHAEIDPSKQFCGIMSNNMEYKVVGLCDNDGGSALVINNTVVGLASQIHYDCDDTLFGSAYTLVSAFELFVNSIINQDPLPGTLVLNNRKFSVAQMALAA